MWIITSFLEGKSDKLRTDVEPLLRVLEESFGIAPGALDGFEIKHVEPEQPDETLSMTKRRPRTKNACNTMLMVVLTGCIELHKRDNDVELLPGDVANIGRDRTKDITIRSSSGKATHILVCRYDLD